MSPTDRSPIAAIPAQTAGRHPRIKRRVRNLLLGALTLCSLVWCGCFWLGPFAIRQMVPLVVQRAQEMGIGVTDLTFSSARISPWMNCVVLRDVHLRFDLNSRDQVPPESQLDSRIVTVRLQRLFPPQGSLSAEEIEVQLGKADLPPSLPFDRLEDGTVLLGNLPLTEPGSAVEQMRSGLRKLILENTLVEGVEFHGDVRLAIQDVEAVAHIYTEHREGQSRLRFREEDIRDVAEKMQLELAPQQVAIVSEYPLRVPALMLLTDRAKSLSQRHEPHDAWLRDAHRHVTWSYLLTQYFGADFARQVTDAQEYKPGNTADERAMDYHNNAMGRRLFAAGETLQTLPQRIRQDPDIIRHPDAVASFGRDRLLH